MAAIAAVVVGAVVDAGPLMSALVLHFARQASPGSRQALIGRSRIADYLVGEPVRQRAFVEFFDSIPKINTTSHVIGELQGLQRFRGGEQRDFWMTSLDWLGGKKLDERLVRLLDLTSSPSWRDIVCRIGPCDGGLIELALKEGTTLLTDDRRTVAPLAWSLGVDCHVVEDLLPQE